MKKRFIFASFLLLFLTGCGTIQLPSLIPRDPTNKNVEKIKNRECVGMLDKDGAYHKACGYESEYRSSQGSVKLNFFQKFFGALGNFTIWTVIAFGIFFIISPTAAMAWLRSRKYKKALVQTVSALKEANVTADVKIANALSDKQDQETKDVVDLIRNKL